MFLLHPVYRNHTVSVCFGYPEPSFKGEFFFLQIRKLAGCVVFHPSWIVGINQL